MFPISLNEVIKYCKKNEINLNALTRFATVKINNKPLIDAEAVVGFENNKLNIFRKDIFGEIKRTIIKNDFDLVEFEVKDLYDILVGQHSIEIRTKNLNIVISDYIEGDIKEFAKILGLKGLKFTEHEWLYYGKKFSNYVLIPVVSVFFGVELIKEIIIERIIDEII